MQKSRRRCALSLCIRCSFCNTALASAERGFMIRDMFANAFRERHGAVRGLVRFLCLLSRSERELALDDSGPGRSASSDTSWEPA